MTIAPSHTVTLTGLQGHLVDVRAVISPGPGELTFTGLPETCWREARDRIRAAICNSGESWPDDSLSVTLTPAVSSGHHGSADLAIAVAVLAAAGAISSPPGHIAFLGELGLDGQLRQIRGVLPAVQAAAAAGCTEVIVPADDAAEAALVPGIRVTGVANLSVALRRICPAVGNGALGRADPRGRRAAHLIPAVICAAGGHHLLLTGPPGYGQNKIAHLISDLIPPLDPAATRQVSALHSLAGKLVPADGLISSPPFIRPHPTTSIGSILGGIQNRPGVVSLAHHGVLFLDGAPEFSRDVLAAIRQPLECGQVQLASVNQVISFPADFTLVMSAAPCPCTGTGTEQPCSCPPAAQRRYQARLAGLASYIDLAVGLHPRPGAVQLGEPATVAAATVADARGRAAVRLAGTPWRLNARIPGSELRRRFPPAAGAMVPAERAIELGEISSAAADRVLAVAWTLADLAGRPQPGAGEVTAALACRQGVSAHTP